MEQFLKEYPVKSSACPRIPSYMAQYSLLTIPKPSLMLLFSIMPRSQRIVIPGLPHHITHRGNNGQDIFFSYENHAEYLNFLKIYSEECKSTINGYCLMTNHIHLIITPLTETALSSVVGKIHGQYSQYINKIQKTSGHIFENRYHSCPLDHNHFINTLKYVERNPVRAGIVDHPSDYEWSSARMHLGIEDQWGLIDQDEWKDLMDATGIDWEKWISNPVEDEIIESIRKHTTSGKHLKA